MKKYISLLALLLVFVLALSGCACKHENWEKADCENPKTCEDCGETEGKAKGHDWIDADCENPKTCDTCGETKGDALGHVWADATCETLKTCSVCGKTEGALADHLWTEADCENPKSCSLCNLTEGDALGHDWLEATTEAPETCTVCAQTRGERIVTDPRFTTAATKDLHGKWTTILSVSGEMMNLEGFPGTMDMEVHLELHNDGSMYMYMLIANEEDFMASMKIYTANVLYAEFEAQGMDKAAADKAMEQAYGMTVEQYVDVALQEVDIGAMFDQFDMEGVYYVDGNQLYSGEYWEQDLEGNQFSLDGDTLLIYGDLSTIGGGDHMTLTRVK